MKIARVQEEYGVSVGTNFWFSVPEHPGALSDQCVARMCNVVDFKANVVNATAFVALQETTNRRIIAQWLQ